jgi:hypothetical protein
VNRRVTAGYHSPARVRVIKARFEGRCDLCGARIRVGDSIASTPAAWVHTKCLIAEATTAVWAGRPA